MNKSVALAEVYPLIKEQLESGGTAGFVTRGTSMKPMLQDGVNTVYIAKPEGGLNKYDIPLYRRDDGSFVLHRVIKVDSDGKYVCRGDNQTLKEHGITDDMIVGVVYEYTKGDKIKKTKGFTYKAYAVYIVHTAVVRAKVRGVLSRIRRKISK